MFRLHVQRDGTRVLENVTPDGKEIQGSLGRLMNPGIDKLVCLVKYFFLGLLKKQPSLIIADDNKALYLFCLMDPLTMQEMSYKVSQAGYVG